MTPRNLPAYVCGALAAAAYGRQPRPGRIATTRGYVYVSLASDARPWAVATGGAPGRHGHPAHEVRRVFLAWKSGRCVGMLVQAQCGAKLTTAELRWWHETTAQRCLRCPQIKAARELAESERALSARSQ